MRKVSQPFKINNCKGWYVRWQEHGKRKHKHLNNMAEVDLFRWRKYQEINSDVYDSVAVSWKEARDMYLQHYDTDNLAASSKYAASQVLDVFADHFGPMPPKEITQRMVDDFFAMLLKKGQSPHTMNRYKGRLKAFMRWLADRSYHTGRIKIRMSKVQQAYHPSLTVAQVHDILRNCPSQIWRVRVLMSLVTGLRRDDIEALQIADVDVAPMQVRTQSKKTGKASIKPLPDALMPLLEPYCRRLKDGRLFPDKNVRKEWDALRLRAGMAEKIDGRIKNFKVTRQDFRRTHGTLMGLADGLQAAARALEHSSTAVTAQYYSDLSLIQRVRVNQLPVAEWLDWEEACNE